MCCPCASRILFQVRKIREEMTEKMEERTAQLFLVTHQGRRLELLCEHYLQQEVDIMMI